jgi:hypothetical protein
LFQWVSLKIGYDLPIHGHFHRTFVILQPALEKFSGQRPSLDFFSRPKNPILSIHDQGAGGRGKS